MKLVTLDLTANTKKFEWYNSRTLDKKLQGNYTVKTFYFENTVAIISYLKYKISAKSLTDDYLLNLVNELNIEFIKELKIACEDIKDADFVNIVCHGDFHKNKKFQDDIFGLLNFKNEYTDIVLGIPDSLQTFIEIYLGNLMDVSNVNFIFSVCESGYSSISSGLIVGRADLIVSKGFYVSSYSSLYAYLINEAIFLMLEYISYNKDFTFDDFKNSVINSLFGDSEIKKMLDLETDKYKQKCVTSSLDDTEVEKIVKSLMLDISQPASTYEVLQS